MAKPAKKKGVKALKEENRVTFRCDQKVWREAEKILEGTGISRGKYCEMMLRSLVQSRTLTMKQIMGNMVEGMFDASILSIGNLEVKKK